MSDIPNQYFDSLISRLEHVQKTQIDAIKVAAGADPFLMQSPNTTDKEAATIQNDKNYAELSRRLKLRLL